MSWKVALNLYVTGLIMTLDSKLLEILVCPKCKGTIALEKETHLLCYDCGLIYPVTDGIPVMLIEEATKIGLSEK